MNTISKLTVCLTLIAFGKVNAQEVKAMPFAKTESKGYPVLYTVNENSAYTVTRDRFGKRYVYHYTNLIQDAEVACEPKVGKNDASINQTLVLNGRLTMFMYVAKGKARKLFIRTYNEAHVPTDSETPIAEYETNEDASGIHTFNITQSKNNEFIAVEFEDADAGSGKARVGVVILDSNLKVVSRSMHLTQYIPNEFKIISRHLSNSGEYYQGTNVYNVRDSGRDLYRESLKETCITKFSSTGNTTLSLKDMNLDLNGRMIADMELNADLRNELICSGVYGVKEQAGLFFFQFDFDSQTVMKQTCHDLQPGAFDSRWVDMGIHQFSRNHNYQHFFHTVDVFETADKGLCFVLEQQELAISIDTPVHYFSDLIIYLINENGDVSWASSADKFLPVEPGDKYAGGVASYHTEKEFVFFFNDQEQNYTPNNEYNKTDGEVAYGVIPKNAVARASVNLKTGEIKRNRLVVLGEEKQDKICFIPGSTLVNYETEEIMIHLYKIGMESFGTLKF